MVNRLTDRIEEGPDGKPVKIHRYGMWGTSTEIECRKKGKWVVVSPKGKVLETFPTLAEAELYLKDLVKYR